MNVLLKNVLILSKRCKAPTVKKVRFTTRKMYFSFGYGDNLKNGALLNIQVLYIHITFEIPLLELCFPSVLLCLSLSWIYM